MRKTHAYCSHCKEESAIGRNGHCLWCDQPTGEAKRRGKPAGVYGRLTDEHIRVIHRYHERGYSIRALGRQIYEKMGYASAESAAMAISDGFKRLHLTAQAQPEATASSNRRRAAKDSPGKANSTEYKRWLRKKNGGMRPCQGVRKNYPNKGRPCQRYALKDSDFCLQHDPKRKAEVVQIAKRARAAA